VISTLLFPDSELTGSAHDKPIVHERWFHPDFSCGKSGYAVRRGDPLVSLASRGLTETVVRLKQPQANLLTAAYGAPKLSIGCDAPKGDACSRSPPAAAALGLLNSKSTPS
jgi:hypothetical protein